MSITTVFEDEYLLAINKPPNVVTNRAETVRNVTLQDWFEDQYSNCFTSLNESSYLSEDIELFRSRSGMVHRLDKDTSGVILWAKNPQVMLELMSLFKQRQIAKSYVALVHGKIKTKQDTITLPLGRTSRDRKKFGVVMGGKVSRTDYKVLDYYMSDNPKYAAGFSLVQLFPKTGRTHQLRVVLKHLGHPIVGDSMYVGRKRARFDAKWCQRQFLHAHTIDFSHPVNSKATSIEAPLAEDLVSVLETLHKVEES